MHSIPGDKEVKLKFVNLKLVNLNQNIVRVVTD